jgi:hypothetical protein
VKNHPEWIDLDESEHPLDSGTALVKHTGFNIAHGREAQDKRV